jgi:hypothetical protein
MLKIKKRVPLPAPQRPQRSRKYPFDDMAVGDMFFVPGGSAKSVASYASRIGSRIRKKFNTRQVIAVHRSDGWKIVEDDSNPTAVRGVGVWRTL